MKRKPIPEGSVFGKLTIIESLPPLPTKMRRFRVKAKCSCGKECIVNEYDLRVGDNKSCGCYSSDMAKERNKKSAIHKMSGSLTYLTWSRMKARCKDKTRKDYANYGGRDIKVCDRWQKFENFFADMGIKPKNMSLDRINSNGNYEPSNCRWTNIKTQNSNRRNVKFILIKDIKMHLSDASKILQISKGAISQRAKIKNCSLQESANHFLNKLNKY